MNLSDTEATKKGIRDRGPSAYGQVPLRGEMSLDYYSLTSFCIMTDIIL